MKDMKGVLVHELRDIWNYIKAVIIKCLLGFVDVEDTKVKISFLTNHECWAFRGAVCAACIDKGYATLDDIYRVLDIRDGLDHERSRLDDHLYWKLDTLDLLPDGNVLKLPKGTFCIRKPVRI